MILSNMSKLKATFESEKPFDVKMILTAGEQASSSTKKSLGSQAGCQHHAIRITNVVVVFITNNPKRLMMNRQASPKQSSQWGGVKHLYRPDQGFQFDLSPSRMVRLICSANNIQWNRGEQIAATSSQLTRVRREVL